MKDEYGDWSSRPYDYSGGVLTQEKIEAAVKKCIEQGSVYECADGHLVDPREWKIGIGFCRRCLSTYGI